MEGLAFTATVALTAGCGGHVEPHPTSLKPDITATGCDKQLSKLEIYEALNKHKPLIANVLVDLKPAKQDIFTGLNSDKPEIVNPIVLVCHGSIKYLVGIDRGFTGIDPPRPEIFPAKNETYTKIVWNEKNHKMEKIAPDQVGKYIIKVTARDEGPNPGGAKGLVANDKAIGAMP